MSIFAILSAAAGAASAQQAPAEPALLYNPYERPKNGPPLTNIFHKANPEWILTKLREPKHHPSARMPEFKFSEEEALEVMAYLKSVAGEAPPALEWPAGAEKSMDEMEDDELDAVFEIIDEGETVWRNARCTVCHAVNGPGGAPLGGFVDLRVGGIDLQTAAAKLRRDWLYAWLKEPKDSFPETLMPRFRFSDAEIRALVEYILRGDPFLPPLEDDEEEAEDGQAERQGWAALGDSERAARGKRLIETARCVLCHEIEGVAELLRWPALVPPPVSSSFEFLAYDLRCLSCHAIDGRGGTYAPDLSGEGARLHEAWIADFVESPDMIRPLSQQMPKFNLTAEEAKTAASYISRRLRDEQAPAEIPGPSVSAEEIRRGRELFQSKGCFACHTVGEGVGGGVGPELDELADRMLAGYVWYHLKNPQAVNPYSAEPDYGLSDDEARALAGYLRRGLSRAAGASFPLTQRLLVAVKGTVPDLSLSASGEELINRREQARQAVLATPQSIYGNYCAHCHSEDATGAGRLWVSDLPAEPADLTALGKDKLYVAEVIREGSTAHGKSNLCPPWGRTLSAVNVERLAQYVASLGAEDSATAAQAPAPPEAAEEPFPWLLLGAVLGEGALLWALLRRKKESNHVLS